MDDRAIRGVLWTVLTYASRKGLSLISTVVLARLLVPADFGLIAVAGTVVLLLSVIQDFGVANTLIVRPDMDTREQGTALTIMMVSGVGLGLTGAALSPLLAAFFRDARLTGVLAALMLTVCFSGVLSFHQVLLQRELRMRERFNAQAAQGVLYAVVSIALAAGGAGVWSLVGGQVASVLGGTVLMLAYARPFWVAPAWDVSAAARVLAQGRGFLAQGGLYFLQQNTDYVVVGRLLDARQLGFYYTSYRLAEIPVLGIAEPVAAVTFPAFASMRARGEDVGRAFRSVLRLIALVACPVGLLLSAAADPFTRVVLGERWLPMAAVLAILGIWSAVRPVGYTIGWLLNAVGASGLVARVSGVLLVPLAVSLYVAAALSGIVAVACVVLAYAVISSLTLAWFAASRGGVRLREQWRAIRPIVIACPVAWVAARAVADASVGPALSSLVLSLTAGSAAYLLTVHIVEPGSLGEAANQIRRTLGAKRRPAEPPGGGPDESVGSRTEPIAGQSREREG